MSLFNSSSIVKDNLVLSLDAANLKSYPGTTLKARYLVVGGGGSGGSDMGGGGGAGGYLAGLFDLSVGAYTVTVGAGGSGNNAGVGSRRGWEGGSSSFVGSNINLVAFGGGGGASNHDRGDNPAGGTNLGLQVGSGGGSSGGGGAASGGSLGYGGSRWGNGTPGQGNDGGIGLGQWYPGGGGGAGGAGNSNPATGGVGIQNDILGTNYFWAGGGGGSGYSNIGGNGGPGGGGAGAIGSTFGGSGLNPGSNGNGGATNSQANVAGSNAGANTGGGGGGGSHYNLTNSGGSGGSGIVVIRYPGPQIATGGTVTTVGSDTVHSFTSSGTFTVNQLPTTSWINLAGTSNNATLVNGITYNSSNKGSLVFNGTNSSANLSSDGFNFSTQQTIIMVLRSTEATADRRNPYNHEYAGYGTITHESNGIFNYYHGSGGGNTSPYQGTSSSFTAVQNEIAFIALTRGTSNIKWYKNGVLFDTITNTIPTAVNTVSTINIGSGYAGPSFQGNIYFVALYDRQLSDAEIFQNFNSLRGRYGL